ncbi:hypothetical protein GCM10010245_66710 [Streptomyces spectabilis]|nr:hypothetical protein GCM10010245_66710 [Streptomyces spectabilis]
MTAVMRRHAGSEFTAAASRHPHMSIAYTSTGAKEVSPGDLREALAGIEQPLVQTVRVDALHLVEQWHDGSMIRWEPRSRWCRWAGRARDASVAGDRSDPGRGRRACGDSRADVHAVR